MSSKMVLYFFQGEHGESEQTPNAFTLNASAKPVSLGEFLQSFPAQEQGPFAFRFRVADKHCGYVWQDISDPSDLLPEYDGVISAKILRLSALTQRPLHSRLRRKLPEAFKQKPFVPPAESQRTPTTPQNQPSTSPRVSQTTQAPSKPSPAASRTPARATPQTPPPDTSFESFLSGSSSSDGPAKAPVTEDFLSFSQPEPVRVSSNGFPHTNGSRHDSPDIDIDDNSRSRSNGASTAAAAATQGGGALDLWHEVQERNTKISEEMDEARLTIGPRLTQWAEDNGKKRNVRTLLSTMHDVLWEGARWKTLTLVDVIDPGQVKLAYRKAMLVVHPDRNANLSGTNMFIAKRIFEAINEAYSIFLEHEQP